jgi:hypothetical protein
MKENSLLTYYRYDSNNYYAGTTSVQVVNGSPLVPDDCTDIKPELDDAYWYKFDNGSWVAEPKPTNASECVGISIKHSDTSPRASELRVLFEQFTANSDGYRLVRDASLTQTVEAIPAKTADEIELSNLEDEQKQMESQLKDLKDQFIVAQMTADTEKLASIKAEYLSLVGE